MTFLASLLARGLREGREPSLLEDPDAAAKSADADAALAILGGDFASIGYFTPTVTLMDEDADRLADRHRLAHWRGR